MPKRAFIIHGYHSFPQEAWLPWLKAELEARGYAAFLPAMPHPDRPTIPEWIGFITKLVGEPDENTVIVGHSLGCQAVLRYLETLGVAGKSVGKTVLVGGTFPPGMTPEEADVWMRESVEWLRTEKEIEAFEKTGAVLADQAQFSVGS